MPALQYNNIYNPLSKSKQLWAPRRLHKTPDLDLAPTRKHQTLGQIAEETHFYPSTRIKQDNSSKQ